MVALEKGMMGQARRVALACHAHGVDQTGAAQLVQHSQRLEDTGELGMVGCQASHVVGRPATNRLEQHAQLCLELQTKRRATSAATAAAACAAANGRAVGGHFSVREEERAGEGARGVRKERHEVFGARVAALSHECAGRIGHLSRVVRDDKDGLWQLGSA
jgi:hypothetical protein|eukprot:jgi/Chrpa1/21455/Chrysochromulina_OHIO_Genome00008579-RA